MSVSATAADDDRHEQLDERHASPARRMSTREPRLKHDARASRSDRERHAVDDVEHAARPATRATNRSRMPVGAGRGAGGRRARRAAELLQTVRRRAQRGGSEAERVRLSNQHGASRDEREQADVDENDGEETSASVNPRRRACRQPRHRVRGAGIKRSRSDHRIARGRALFVELDVQLEVD